MFSLHHANKKHPKYIQLAEVIRNAIVEGQLRSGDILPSVKLLSDNLQLNRHTVMRAFAELIAEGWVISQERMGYKVADFLPIETSLLHQKLSGVDENTFNYRLVKSVSHQSEDSPSHYQYNFSGGEPDTQAFPFKEFRSYMSDVLSRPDLSQLSYGETAGTEDLLFEVESYLRKSRGVTNKDIIITNGSQEALYIISQLLLQAGDKVAVEALGYAPAMSVFASVGAELISVKQDQEGIDPEDLKCQIVKGDIRLIYLTPLHQYPTTVTLSVGRRAAIYKLAYEHNIPIIEDDYDHEFHYRCQPLAPMAAQDPKQLVIYISTFSKIMFPGARLGFMAINSTLAQSVKAYRKLICHKSNVLMQSALSRWMKSGGFTRHLRRTTRTNLKRRDHAILLLKQLDIFDFVIPDGGMALWLKIKSAKVSAKVLAEKAKQYDIYIQHEEEFRINKTMNTDKFIRIGFAGMNEDKFAQGIKILANIYHTI